jgi:hypothetical protein
VNKRYTYALALVVKVLNDELEAAATKPIITLR